MKILLANPAVREKISDRTERYYIKAGSRWPWSYVKNIKDVCIPPFPFYLAYSARILIDEGFDVYALDGVALNMEKVDFVRKAVSIAPDLLVIETAMHAFRHDIELAEELKATLPGMKIIFAGPFATTNSRKILEDNMFVDFALRGEYEFVLAELAKRLRGGVSDLKIEGLAYRKNGVVYVSDKKGFIEDVNTLPYPAFDIFPSNDAPDMTCYYDGICSYKPAITLHSSRGCPFKCDFCLWNQVMYDNRAYRMFDPKRVVDEMEYVIQKFGAREIYFDDDDFCINKNHVLEICGEIKQRKLLIKWSCMGDAICCDEEMIEAMADAGCIFMKFGVESGNRKILENTGKPLDPDRAVQISKWCRKYGIMTHATFVLGLYGETPETMHDTLDLANRIKFDYAQVSIATPFPGTRLYDKLVREGSIRDVDYDRFDGTQTCVFDSCSLAAEQVEEFRKKSIRSLVLHKVLDPGWWNNYLRRNVILYREFGFGRVVEPLKALLRLRQGRVRLETEH